MMSFSIKNSFFSLFKNNENSSSNNWVLIIIFVLIVGFITYSGLKKHRKQKKERKSREVQVKKIIKNYVHEKQKLKNIAVKFIDVFPRSGKEYRQRDVYDVFIEIINPKKNQIVEKKAYEIEGFATPIKSDIKDDYQIDWIINREFDYSEHRKFFLQKSVPSYFEIYFKSIFKKNRKQYIKEEKEKTDAWRKKQTWLHSSLKKIKKEKNVFRPSLKKDEES